MRVGGRRAVRASPRDGAAAAGELRMVDGSVPQRREQSDATETLCGVTDRLRTGCGSPPCSCPRQWCFSLNVHLDVRQASTCTKCWTVKSPRR
jgi:hypothetical protein